jgi:hypothetical protein
MGADCKRGTAAYLGVLLGNAVGLFARLAARHWNQQPWLFLGEALDMKLCA